ncbi:prepilin peptidase [Planctomicrobium piriforme]|uniref:Leader peptidase (Prepilin peptidase) / N-methyltransferase n=1 Tax=Planctomicrobium piriforme TaxID=1576369 RepID=A0A1I3K6D0_9PLAN|nr:A24 family peptidase [Planctomicrobium piriforme]SFI68063.1 leader peptidase (prepilin peptidase) / N-methyltransferase [Planctomicrobium piriforme]
MQFLFEQFGLPVAALLLGALTGVLTYFGTARAFRDLELTPGKWPLAFGGLGVVLGAAFVWTTLDWNWQSTPEVLPPAGFREGRVLFHLSLIVLLLIITATDLKSYLILEWCCWAGAIIALVGAFASGHFQLAHVWVDWNAEIPQLRGPDLPEWLKHHPHLHGLAWSAAGAVCGFVATAVVRWLAAFVLRTAALGEGDVLLMGMVGAYLGWQPTLVALLIAPLLAVGIGSVLRLTGNRPALPYGPFLAAGSLIVLFAWRWIWMAEISFSAHGGQDRSTTFAVRRFFGDPVALLLIAGLSVGLLVLLLGLLQVYRMLPGKKSG